MQVSAAIRTNTRRLSVLWLYHCHRKGAFLLTQTEFWNKEFPITSITRADLVSAGFTKEQVEALSDPDMAEIASAMEDVYCDHGYWEDLELCANRVLKGNQEEKDLGLT